MRLIYFLIFMPSTYFIRAPHGLALLLTGRHHFSGVAWTRGLGVAFDRPSPMRQGHHMIVNRIVRNPRLSRPPAIGAKSHQVFRLIAMNSPKIVEKRPEPGDQVRVRDGVFRDVEGTVIERAKEFRLIVAVHLLQHGVTLEIDEQSLEVIG